MRSASAILEHYGKYEIIVVDDNSDDGTKNILKLASENISNIVYLNNTQRNGLRYAHYLGIKRATGRFIIIMDCDLQHPVDILPKIISKLKEGFDIVNASRFVSNEISNENKYLRQFLSRITGHICHILIPRSRDFTDITSGFFGFSRKVKLDATLIKDSYKVLLNIMAINPNLKTTEIPYTFKKREQGHSKLVSNPKFLVNFTRELIYNAKLNRKIGSDPQQLKTILLYNWRDILNPLAGGAERYCYEIATRLSRDGYNVVWITSRGKGQKKFEIYNGIRIKRIGGIFSVFIFSFFASIGYKNIEASICSINSIPFFINPNHRDNRILIIHHLVPFKTLREKLKFLSPLAFFLQNVLMPFYFRNTKILAVSPSTVYDLKHYGYTKVEYVKLGVERFSFKSNKKNQIVAPGPIRPWKGHSDIIKAFAALPKDYKLVIFGNSETKAYESRLKKLTIDLGLDDRVSFMGRITEDEKYRIFSESSLCILATEKEGWGFVAMEAQAMACPVVAYDVPGIRDSIRNKSTGILVPYRDISLLSQAMIDLLYNRELLRQYSKNAYEWAINFDWETCYSDFTKNLEHLSSEVVKEDFGEDTLFRNEFLINK